MSSATALQSDEVREEGWNIAGGYTWCKPKGQNFLTLSKTENHIFLTVMWRIGIIKLHYSRTWIGFEGFQGCSMCQGSQGKVGFCLVLPIQPRWTCPCPRQTLSSNPNHSIIPSTACIKICCWTGLSFWKVQSKWSTFQCHIFSVMY